MTQPIDTAYVDVRPDVDGFADALDRQLTAALNKAQANVDRSTRRVTASFRRTADDIGKQGARAGKQFSAAVTDGLAATSVGLRKLDAQIEASTKTVEELRRKIGESGDLGLVEDLEKADRALAKLARQRKLILPFGADAAEDAGDDAAEGFSLRFSQRIGPLIAKAPVGPGLLGAVAAAVPIVAPAVANMIAIGAAGGAVALGAAISGRDPQVQIALTSLKAKIGESLTDSARPFVPAMLDGIDKVSSRFESLRPELDAIFAKSSTYLDPLIEGGTGFLRNMLPGFRKLVDAAEPLVDVLGEELPELGEDFADLMGDVADAAKEGKDEFRATLDLLGLIVSTSGNLLPIFTKVNGVLDLWSANLDGANVKLEGAGYLAEVAANKFSKMNQNWTNRAIWIEPVEQLATAWEIAADEAEKAARATRDYADANRTLTDQNLSVAESMVRYKEAINAARDAVDSKKKVSLEEESALLAQARASNTVIDSLDRQGASAAVLAEKHRMARKELIETALRMGYTETQAKRLADQYLATPRQINTLFTADTDQAARNLRAVRGLAAQIQSKRVVITVDVRGRQTVRVGGRNVPIGDLGGVAEGGYIDGPGPKGVDSVPKMLAPGEYVLNAKAVDRVGVGVLDAVNSGRGAASLGAAARLRDLTGTQDRPAPAAAQPAATFAPTAVTPAAEPPINVQVFLGTREIRDIVGVEIQRNNRAEARKLAARPRIL